MATDLIQRAAAICGVPEPNSDQLAAWLQDRVGPDGVELRLFDRDSRVTYGEWWRWHGDLLHCLAAAVVEVDRIEREAAK